MKKRLNYANFTFSKKGRKDMTDEAKKEEAGAPGPAGKPGNLPPTASDYADLAGRLDKVEAALELIAPRLVKMENFVKGAAEQAAKMLPPAARKGFLDEILGDKKGG